MKKLFLVATLLFGISTVSSAQNFENGTTIGGIGVGVGGNRGIPIYLSIEHGIWDIAPLHTIGVGGHISYARKSNYVNSSEVKTRNFLLAASADYHYTGISQLDLFGGVILGYRSASSKLITGCTSELPASNGDLEFDLHIGARYYVVNNLAVAADIGLGLSTLSIGIAYSF